MVLTLRIPLFPKASEGHELSASFSEDTPPSSPSEEMICQRIRHITSVLVTNRYHRHPSWHYYVHCSRLCHIKTDEQIIIGEKLCAGR